LRIYDFRLRIYDSEVDEKEFKDRTKRLAVRIVRVVEGLSPTRTNEVIGRQLLRAGTSIGANYRAACRAQSVPDMIAKLKDVEEESDESLYWLELLIELEILPKAKLDLLMQEIEAILRMIVASLKTLRTKSQKSPPKPYVTTGTVPISKS